METSKKIEDYLHLYLGCELLSKSTGEVVATLLGVVGNEAHFKVSGVKYSARCDNYKPILRPLSDMTEEERSELIYLQNADQRAYYEMAAQVKYLISKYFDLFGLIEAGLAIDKTKL